MDWARILAYVTGTVNQELLARIEYLAAENRILKAQSKGRLKLSDAERATLAEIGHRLGRKILAEVATVARPKVINCRKRVARCQPDELRTILVCPKDLRTLPVHPEPAVSWHCGVRGGAHLNRSVSRHAQV